MGSYVPDSKKYVGGTPGTGGSYIPGDGEAVKDEVEAKVAKERVDDFETLHWRRRLERIKEAEVNKDYALLRKYLDKENAKTVKAAIIAALDNA